MKLFIVKSLVKLTVVGVVGLTALQSAHADVSDLRIRFASGCYEENTTGQCSVRVLASGSEFDSNDRVVLYASKGPGQPLRRASNHFRYLSSRGTTVANIKNIPGGCFQVRTWTAYDEASVRFIGDYDQYPTGGALNRCYTGRGSKNSHRGGCTGNLVTQTREVRSNVICEDRVR